MLSKYLKFLFICALLIVQSCSKDSNESTPPAEPIEAAQFLNETYGNEPKQDYDIYLPKDRTTDTPVIILVHGGFWVSGDKSDMNVLVSLSRTKLPNFAIVNTNYRLATTTANKHPAQLNDLTSLIAKLNAKRNEYKISDDYYFIGVSAGGHLSLLYTYKADTNHHVKAVCSIVGPTDFLDPAYLDSSNIEFQLIAAQYLGDTYQNNPALYQDISPISHVESSDAPTILFYGGQDDLVPVSQPTRLKEKLTSVNIPVEYTSYPNAGHTLTGVDFNEMATKIATFFKRY